MAARPKDKQRKKIVADYIVLQSVNAAAKKNNVAWGTAKKILDEDKDLEKKLEQKKAENTSDILTYMERQREAVCEIIGVGLEVLPEKIRDAKTASEVTTALGTLIDKWTQIGYFIRGKIEFEDDPITRALKEENNGIV